MRVLLTGADGYLGCIATSLLRREGHDVVGVDTGFYREGQLYEDDEDRSVVAVRDVRELNVEDLRGFPAVVHMAELSNDSLGELSPEITYAINHRGSVRLAELAKEAGVERFVYMSSCSVYGVATDGAVTETSPLNPQTDYAKCKVLVEQDLHRLADDHFSPTFLRNATAFGASPRMRFDLVLNNLAGWAWCEQEIRMTSDGSPWRPLVHARDIGKAIACVLAAPRVMVHDEIFNVGSDDQNYQIKEIAETVGEVFDGCTLHFGKQGSDNRSYRVGFQKIASTLGFECDWPAIRGAEELRAIFARIGMPRETFDFRAFTRLRQLRHLLDTNQLDPAFFWVPKA